MQRNFGLVKKKEEGVLKRFMKSYRQMLVLVTIGIFFLPDQGACFQNRISQASSSSLFNAESFDKRVLTVLRSFPLGGSITGELGWNYELWNTSQSSTDFWQFGLLRPSIILGSHGMVKASLDIFPISFWKLSWSQSRTFRYYKTATLDCEIYDCGGYLDRQSVTSEIAIGFESFVFGHSSTLSWLKPQNAQKDFASEDDNLPGKMAKDDVFNQSLFLGYKYEYWLFGLVARQSFMSQFGAKSQSEYVMVRQSWASDGKWFIDFGLGSFKSDFTKNEFSSFIGLSWEDGKSRALFH